MKRTDFHYHLPEALIAQYPLENRRDSRLLALEGNSGHCRDLQFADLAGLLNPGDLLVFNNTRVIPARLRGSKETGGKVEVLVERIIDDNRVLAHVRASKSPRPGQRLQLEDCLTAEVEGRDNDLFILHFPGDTSVLEQLEQYGHMPLPPYIQRADENPDRERYQTVYAERPGAVAAPTAGLHFDHDMLEQLQAIGIETAQVTLHVGAGTFQPVRADRLEDHHMHSEWIEVHEAVCEQVRACHARGNRVVAVGTTAVRCLETAAKSGEIAPYCGDTDIFIYPGYEFNVIDAMITNFHLPESTLLMLICAFAGYTEVMQAYAHAVEQQYRFFSYGDAMFITRKEHSS